MSIIDSLTRPRTLAVLLAASLALNLFLAGTIAGRLGAQRLQGAPAGAAENEPLRFVPEAGRQAMREQLRRQRPELRGAHRELRAIYERIGEELQREQPDRESLVQLHREARELQATIEEALQGAFLDSVLGMPQAEREAMVERMRQHRGSPFPGPPPRRPRGLPPGGEPPPDDPAGPPEAP